MQLPKSKLLSAQTLESVLAVILIIGGIAGFIELIDGQQKAVREITQIQSKPAGIRDTVAPAPVWTGSTIELAWYTLFSGFGVTKPFTDTRPIVFDA